MATKNKAYVFIGNKRTTTGTPNKITGRYNIHGDLKMFETRAARDYFFDTYVSQCANKLIYKTNLNDAKKHFCAGLNKNQFKEYISLVDNGYIEIH